MGPDSEGSRILESCRTHQHLDTQLLQCVGRFKCVHALDGLAHSSHDASEIDVQSRFDGIKAISIGRAQVPCDARRLEQCLARHTAVVGAISADTFLLDECDICSEPGREWCRPHARRAGPDHHEIVLVHLSPYLATADDPAQ
jgi:hypothetical protein